MKKHEIYFLAAFLLLSAVAAIVYKYNINQNKKNNTIYTLLERKGPLANSKEWQAVKQQADALIATLKENPNNTKAALKLASLYIQEARETGNNMYYDVAAMQQINKVLAAEPENFDALVFKSLIELSQHHFAEGLQTAKKASTINPYNGYVYGLLVDGNVEMGNYDTAVVYADKMVATRPDLTSYARVSYLREIYGDYDGAIKAMKMAVETGGAGDEHTEWTRVQLAQLYEKIGNFKKADTLYNYSLGLRSSYPYALAGLGRVAISEKNYTKAIQYFQQADSLITDNGIKEELAEAYFLNGERKIADELTQLVIKDLSENAKAAADDESIGHYADKELAYAYLKVKNVDKALEHALQEYNRRPENIDVNEAVAWVYYHKGDYDNAAKYAKVALKTNAKNPVLLARTGLIFYKKGDKLLAKTLLQHVNANVISDSQLRTEAEAAYKML